MSASWQRKLYGMQYIGRESSTMQDETDVTLEENMPLNNQITCIVSYEVPSFII